MTARIIHNEEGYTLQVDHPLGDSFPAHPWESGAMDDYFRYLMYNGESGNKAFEFASELEVVEA